MEVTLSSYSSDKKRIYVRDLPESGLTLDQAEILRDDLDLAIKETYVNIHTRADVANL